MPLLAYRATFHIVGLDSYLPYLAQVVVLHAIAVAGAYVLVRRRIGRLAATLVSVPLLLLGSGAENLFWAFQTGFVGAVAFGVWCLVALKVVRRGDCFLITAAGPQPSATLLGPDGRRFGVSAGRRERIRAVLGLELSPTRPLVVGLTAGTPVDVVVPDIRPVTSARLRIELAGSSSSVRMCPRSRPRG